VSGDAPPRVVLLDDASGRIGALIETVHKITSHVDTPHALIGGLAVMARLGERHRATVDVDAVYLGGDGVDDLRAILVAEGAVSTGSHLSYGGVTIDPIEVGDIVDGELPDDPVQRSFVLAHKWALDSATPVRLEVVSSVHSAIAPTASTPALLAMKLSCFWADGQRAANTSARPIYSTSIAFSLLQTSQRCGRRTRPRRPSSARCRRCWLPG